MSKNFYHINRGLLITPRPAPATPDDGAIWYDSGINKFRKRQNGVTSDLGDSSGNAQEIIERLRAQLDNSPFILASYNIIKETLLTEIQSTTGALSSAQDSVHFSAVSQYLESKQLLDQSFLTSGKQLNKADFSIFYLATAIDSAPTIQASRDGGTTYQSVAVARVGTSDTYRGAITFTDEVTLQALDQYAVVNADGTVELTGSGGARALCAQPYSPSVAQRLRQVTLYLNKVGAVTGRVKVQIVKDSGGNPSLLPADIMCESSYLDIAGFSAGNSTQVFPLDGIVPAGSYHILVRPDAQYSAVYSTGALALSIRVDGSAPAKPVHKNYNGTSFVWSAATAAFTYLVEGNPLELRLKAISGGTSVDVVGYGVLYDYSPVVQAAPKMREVVKFTNTNPNVFTLTNFVPDPELLAVWDTNTGQVYRYPAFTVSGRVITFPANTFQQADPNETICLIFEQWEGSVDNSESNAALLAENRLGSTVAGLDKSVAGQGILLRASNGTLVEASIVWNGSNYVWQFATVP